ncbi:MAG: molecular chaperone DnaJ [Gammaproteobacteria bacterium RIFOXYD12_FULL_61_37]|nr:MAG: molecular chaperone DnaJ [Gammaproteobacteria bacterium RIFOXYD12_FULL_61_37]
MEFGANPFSETAFWAMAALDGLILAIAFWHAPWQRFIEDRRSNVYFGILVVLMLLWGMRVEVTNGLQFHLLGVTSLTLMFGWPLGVIGSVLALAGVTLAGWSEWAGLPFSIVTIGLVPVSLTFIIMLVVRAYLPKHFYIFVFVNAFVTGGLAGLTCGYLAAGMLALGGVQSFGHLRETVMPFFPIMFFPEAMFNGWMMTLMVVFKPDWVYSFSDREYLAGK